MIDTQELSKISAAELIQLHRAAVHVRLCEEEMTKSHPLRSFALRPEEWTELKAHLTDGGGALDDAPLGRELLQALIDDDQAAFWSALVHLMKAWLKIRCHIEPLPSGGVKFNGVGERP
jgi:hypothetical protein